MSVLVSAVKKHEERDSLIVRLHNPSGSPVTCRIKVDAPRFTPAHVFRTNLREERQESLPLVDGGWVDCAVHGKGLLTLELVPG